MFTAADHPLLARQVCEAMDLPVAPNNINSARLKLKRLADRWILAESEPGLFTQPAVADRRRRWPSQGEERPLATHSEWLCGALPARYVARVTSFGPQL